MTHTTKNSLTNMPSDLQLEREILGGCIGEDTSKLSSARSLVAEDHFTIELHREVWRSLCRLNDAGRALTMVEIHSDITARGRLVTLGELLEFDGMNWWAVDQYLPRLVELTKKRRLMLRGHQLLLAAADPIATSGDVAASAINGIQSDLDGIDLNEPEHANDIIEAVGGIDKFLACSDGVLTPWPRMNEVTSGWQPGELAIIAARPSMGKTAFALNACVRAAVNGTATVFYSFEMSREAILKRLISMKTGIVYQQIISGTLNPILRRMVIEAVDHIHQLPLSIVGASGRTVIAVRSHAERLARRGRCGMMALDYIGLVRAADTDGEQNRTRQLGDICRQLKNLATQLHIPALVLAQLNRSTESRNDKRPMMGDLRDSGELEEHADLIALLHRPGYYDRKNPDIQLVAEVIIAKQRNGDTPVIQLEFHRNNGRFSDPEEREAPTSTGSFEFGDQGAHRVQ